MVDTGTIALILVIILIIILLVLALIFLIRSTDLNNNRSNLYIEYINENIIRQPTISTIYITTTDFYIDILPGVRRGNIIGVKNISDEDITVNEDIVESNQYIEYIVSDTLIRLI